MQKLIDFILTNPKKAIVVLIALLVFAIGNFLLSGCAFKSFFQADNVTRSIYLDIKEL